MADTTRPQTPWFQFSLARLLLAMTAIALLLGFSSTIGGTIALFGSIILYILAAGLLSVAVYGRGDFQAFAIGALVPCVAYFITPTHSNSAWANAGRLIELLFTSGACGAVAAITRRWIRENTSD